MTTEKTTVPAIYGALLAIQKDVPTLQKNGVGPSTQGGYKFLAVDDVLSAVRPLLDKHGVIVSPKLLDHGFHYNTALPKDNERVPRENVQAWVKYEFTFIAAVDGSQLSTVVIGEGTDTQDKAVRKATTSAWKIALIQTFALITGEPDPDASDGGRANNEAEASKPDPASLQRAKVQPVAVANAGNARLNQIRAELNKLMSLKELTPKGNEFFNTEKAADWSGDVAKLEKLLAHLKTGEV